MSEMVEVVTVRVPKGTKVLLKRNRINVSRDFRNFINAKINAAKLIGEYKAIEKRAKKRIVSGESAQMIREDRDSR